MDKERPSEGEMERFGEAFKELAKKHNADAFFLIAARETTGSPRVDLVCLYQGDTLRLGIYISDLIEKSMDEDGELAGNLLEIFSKTLVLYHSRDHSGNLPQA